MVAVIRPEELWSELGLREKSRNLLTRSWTPTREAREKAARRLLLHEVFGGPEDMGPELFDLTLAHSQERWDLSILSDKDTERAMALEAHTVATGQRVSGVRTVPPMNLRLRSRAPAMAMLVFPLVPKVPVVALRHFVQVHAPFAFAKIRSSGHPDADQIIACLYDVLFLQQKTAAQLCQFAEYSNTTQQDKGDAALVHAELDAIMCADLLFAYLKASVEKTLSLVALTHSIHNLDSKRKHKQRLDALARALPEETKSTFYGTFVLEMFSSESLDELNTYRSGLLHKKGISDLQPHSYAKVGAEELPLRKVFSVMLEQHAKNSAVLLGALAMLVDELMRRDPESSA